KSANFAILYGVSAFGLSQATKIDQKDAQKYISDYFAMHPRVRAFIDRTLVEGRDRGYVSTLLGRRRYLPDLRSGNPVARNAAERMAMNAPVQGTASDMIKTAMVRIRAAIVFAEPSRRKRLEAILHPAIRARFDARLDALTREGFEGIVVFDAPVMIESGGYKNMDRLIVVVTDEVIQRARLVARDADAADGERRIASQMPLAEKAKLADYVIDNTGDRAATEARTREVHAALVRDLAARARAGR